MGTDFWVRQAMVQRRRPNTFSLAELEGNHLSRRVLHFKQPVTTDCLELHLTAPNGFIPAARSLRSPLLYVSRGYGQRRQTSRSVSKWGDRNRTFLLPSCWCGSSQGQSFRTFGSASYLETPRLLSVEPAPGIRSADYNRLPGS